MRLVDADAQLEWLNMLSHEVRADEKLVELDKVRDIVTGSPTIAVSQWYGIDTKGQGGESMTCKWLSDEFSAICTNADCPVCADFCPCSHYPEICRYSGAENASVGDDVGRKMHLIKRIMKNMILVPGEGNNYRPVKNTSRNDCYRALYKIQEILKTNKFRLGYRR